MDFIRVIINKTNHEFIRLDNLTKAGIENLILAIRRESIWVVNDDISIEYFTIFFLRKFHFIDIVILKKN